MRSVRVDPSSAHEINAVLDTACQITVLLNFLAVGEAKCPCIDTFHVSEPAS